MCVIISIRYSEILADYECHDGFKNRVTFSQGNVPSFFCCDLHNFVSIRVSLFPSDTANFSLIINVMMGLQ